MLPLAVSQPSEVTAENRPFVSQRALPPPEYPTSHVTITVSPVAPKKKKDLFKEKDFKEKD